MEEKKGLTKTQSWILGCGLFFIIGIVAICSVAVVLLFANKSVRENEKVIGGSGNEKIGVIRISGVLSEDEGGLLIASSAISSVRLRQELESLAQDPDLKAIILRINSPGGSAVESEELYQAVVNFKKSGKIVVSSLGDTAASGGYYVALSADEIIASQATITGSLGAIAEITNLSGLYEKLGLQAEVYKTGTEKDIFSQTRERTDEEKEIIQKVIDDSFQLFLERIAERRKMEINEVKKMADGRIYSGQQALDLKLIDKLGNYEDAVSEAKRLAGIEEAKLVEYTSEPTIWDFILQLSSQKFNPLLKSLENLDLTSGFKIRYLLSP